MVTFFKDCHEVRLSTRSVDTNNPSNDLRRVIDLGAYGKYKLPGKSGLQQCLNSC